MIDAYSGDADVMPQQ